MATVWFTSGGIASVRSLLSVSNTADRSGVIDVSTQYPGIVPANAVTLILTVVRGYSTTPLTSSVVSLRVMPNGYNLTNVLDRAKTQARLGGGLPGIDLIAQDVRMPIINGIQKFFFALQSSDSATANKVAAIDLWGYET